MNELKSYCEFTAAPEKSMRTLILQILLMCFYTLFTAAYVFFLFVLLRVWQLLLLLPFIMYAVFGLTWRYTRVEYEFSLEAGQLTVSRIYDRRSRRVGFTADLAEAMRISPLTDRARLSAPDIVSVKDFSSSADSESAWYIILPDSRSGKKQAVVIETVPDMLRLLKLANPSVFVKQ